MRKIAILLCIVIIGVTVITFAPTLAQDSGGTNIPIPTPHPVDELVGAKNGWDTVGELNLGAISDICKAR